MADKDDHKNSQNFTELTIYNPYEDLSPVHRKAVDLRLEFFKYKYIAHKVKRDENTVRHWFEVGGICKAAYDWMLGVRKVENEEMNIKIRQELQDLSPEAILVLKGALTKGDAKTAIDILAINGIVATQKLDIDLHNREKVDSFSKLLDELSTKRDDKPRTNPNHTQLN